MKTLIRKLKRLWRRWFRGRGRKHSTVLYRPSRVLVRLDDSTVGLITLMPSLREGQYWPVRGAFHLSTLPIHLN